MRIPLVASLVCAALLPSPASGQAAETSEQRLARSRAEFLQAMKPVCRDRAADLKAKRRPKRFAAFLLSLPAEIRPEVILACDSM